METPTLILRIVYGAFFCFAGIMHFVKPRFFFNFIPSFIPKLSANWIVGFIEIILGLSIFINSLVNNAALGIIILLIMLTPIHIWDFLKEKPAIGSKKIAFFRIPFQFILILGAYIIYINT